MYPLLNVTSTLRGFGGKGIRTPDLLIANETLYQLSYTPELRAETITMPEFFIKRKDRFRSEHCFHTYHQSPITSH